MLSDQGLRLGVAAVLLLLDNLLKLSDSLLSDLRLAQDLFLELMDEQVVLVGFGGEFLLCLGQVLLVALFKGFFDITEFLNLGLLLFQRFGHFIH